MGYIPYKEVLENAADLYPDSLFLPTSLLNSGAESVAEFNKEMEILESQGILDKQVGIELGDDKIGEINEDLSYHEQRAIDTRIGFQKFWAELSGSNLTEGEALELYMELFDANEIRQLEIEEEREAELK